MQARSECVKAAIARCGMWYEARDCNIRTLTERIEALWLEVEHLLCLMEQAERENDREAAANTLKRVIHHVARIQGEVAAQGT